MSAPEAAAAPVEQTPVDVAEAPAAPVEETLKVEAAVIPPVSYIPFVPFPKVHWRQKTQAPAQVEETPAEAEATPAAAAEEAPKDDTQPVC